MASHGKIFELVPYALRTLWSAYERPCLVPTFFEVRRTVNLRSMPRHPLQALLLAGLIWWRLRSGRRG